MELLSLLDGLFALFAVVSALVARSAARSARRDSRGHALNADELVLVNARLDLLGSAIKRMEGRQTKNISLRNAKHDPDAEPDAKTDPEGWRSWKNRQLMQNRMTRQ